MLDRPSLVLTGRVVIDDNNVRKLTINCKPFVVDAIQIYQYFMCQNDLTVFHIRYDLHEDLQNFRCKKEQ